MSTQPPSYDDVAAGVATAQTVEAERQKGFFDVAYYRGVPGLLKLLEVVLCLIAQIIIAVSAVYCTSSTDGFFKFVTLGSCIATLVLWAVLLLKVPQRCLRCDCVNWIFVEFVFYAVTIIFYFFANLFMSIQACTSLHKAAVAFGWFAFVPYIVDFVFAVRRYLEQRRLSRQAFQGGASPGVTVDNS